MQQTEDSGRERERKKEETDGGREKEREIKIKSQCALVSALSRRLYNVTSRISCRCVTFTHARVALIDPRYSCDINKKIARS